MQWFTLDKDGFGSVLSFGGEGADLELVFALMNISREVSTVVFVDVGVSAGTIDSVVGLSGADFDVVRFHIEINFMKGRGFIILLQCKSKVNLID